MECSRCKTELMLDSSGTSGFYRCVRCDLFWCSEMQLPQIARRLTTIPAGSGQAQSAISPKTAIERLCPGCQGCLTESPYADSATVKARKCVSCSAFWQTRSELEQIGRVLAKSAKKSKLADALEADLQGYHKLLRLRSIYRSPFCAMLAVLLLLVVMLLLGASWPRVAVSGLLFAIFPLALKFCDELGTITGVGVGLGNAPITERTPGDFVAIGLWVLAVIAGGLAIAGLLAA